MVPTLFHSRFRKKQFSFLNAQKQNLTNFKILGKKLKVLESRLYITDSANHLFIETKFPLHTAAHWQFQFYRVCLNHKCYFRSL